MMAFSINPNRSANLIPLSFVSLVIKMILWAFRSSIMNLMDRFRPLHRVGRLEGQGHRGYEALGRNDGGVPEIRDGDA